MKETDPTWTRITEVVAVVLNLAYTWLYLRADPWCYTFGIAGPLALAAVCYQRRLFGEVLLQAVYIAMAIYGWLGLSGEWSERAWTPIQHAAVLVLALAGALAGGWWLRKRTRASAPVADGFTTSFGIAGTWLMVNYVHANWLYFIGVNALSIGMYSYRRMYVATAMFVIYLLMSVDGYWRLGIFGG